MPATQTEFPFKSLDFPGRTTLYPNEVAERLGVSLQHIFNLIDEGAIGTINLTGEGNLTARRCLRIPIELYRDFVLARLHGPARALLIGALPRATLREIQREIATVLNA